MTFENRLRRLCLFSLEKRRLRRGGSNSSIQNFLEGGYRAQSQTLRGGQQKDERQQTQVAVKEILIKHIEKNLFTAEMVIHWKRLPTVTSESLFLEIQNSSGPEQPHTTSKVALFCMEDRGR